MGKAQSKRSVDITTEVKKDDVPEEGTGKMGKIEDVDQLKPHVNGDTNHSESDVGDKEKSADTEGTENEKDLSTEKEQQAAEPKANLEGGDETKADTATTPTGDKPVENGNGNDDTLNDSKNAGETTNENGDSSKKPKKEKVKKKWSLRSISFGKKDKQKPSKKEETTTNGECEKVPEEGAEETTKNGDATPEENPATNASSDEKSPATSPATESKDVTTPAAEATPAAESTPVVNGSSEPAKEDKPVAEVAPTVVAEEKAPEPAVVAAPVAPAAAATEEPPEVDAAPEPVAAPVTESAPVVSAEPAKTEEIPVPAKIEVNAETVQDETNENKLEAASAVASGPPQQGDNDKENKVDEELINKNIGGDNESAQNLPPPPLPCTSPPSQVSVFALSDDSSKENTETEELPVPSPDIADLKPVEQSSIIEDASFTEIPETLPVAETEKDEIPSIEETIENVPVTAPVQNNPEEKTADNISLVENLPTATNESLIEEQKSSSQEEQNQQEPLSATPLEPSPVNSEQIAQTIALIDEVTKEAAITVNSQLEEVKSEQSPEQTAEPVSNEPHTPTGIQSMEPTTLPHTDSPLPEEQKPIVPEELSTSEPSSLVDVEASLPNEESSAAQSLPDVLDDKAETIPAPKELIGDHGDLTQIDEANATSIIVKEEEKISVTEDKASIAMVDDPIEKVPVDVTELLTNLPTATASETEDATAKLKENGFGENHSAETSATESLNGQSDHKTIEAMKSECSEKLTSEPTRELASDAIEVKE